MDHSASIRRRLDRSLDPPQYVDEEIPTVTRVFRDPANRGRVRAPRGTLTGSLRLTGSFRELTPGSYSLRITRLSIFTGSRNMDWAI